MNMLPLLARSAGFLLLVGAVLLPSPADGQVLSVSPTSVTVQAAAGTDAASQTLQIRNAGNGALKWTARASSSWLSVSPASGVNSGSLTLTFRTASLAAGQYQTSFTVESNGGSQNVTVQATIGSGSGGSGGGGGGGGTGTPTISVSSSTVAPGSSVTVNFSVPNATSTDWIALSVGGSAINEYLDWKYAGSCTRTPGTAKTSGSCAFTAPSTAGTYQFRLFANNVFTLMATVTVTVSGTSLAPPPPPPAPSPTGRGPQSTITCPSGSVDIWPGANIQSMVTAYAGNTTFCLRSGVHALTYSIIPKTGNTFVGEFGAVLDGSNWRTTDDTQAAFRGHNADIDYVTIRNLVIRNMPQRGIHAFYHMSNHWTIENNEIAHNKNVGVHFAPNFIIRNNYIHNNLFSGYMGPYAHNTLIENNEIAYNGTEQKVMESANVTFRNNFVHHNRGGGIWYDSDNTGVLIEGNRVEDNGYSGIWLEISSGITVRNNVVRRNGDAGIFVSTSKNAQIHNNTLEHNYRGITYFVNCPSVGGGLIRFDLANIAAYDNTIVVGTQSGAFASLFSYAACTSTQAAPYVNGQKGLTFSRNTYRVPSPTSGQYWYWVTHRYWYQWQAIPQDPTGTVTQ